MKEESTIKKQSLSFLSGGGEMGKRTREFDWSKTSLGMPENWPINLQMILGLVLSSKFPMFIWWGPELIQFYNDAYRPSLGNNGKHPDALGSKGSEFWPEIWKDIYPQIQQVLLKGESTWQEDQLLPIYRNGRLEDVYWTYSYSPIFDEKGKVDGVLVICNETTTKMQDAEKLIKREGQIRSLVESAPFPIGVYTGREMRIELVNPAIIETWGKGKDVVGKLYSEVLPELDNQEVYKQLDDVYTSGKAFHATNRRIDLVVNNKLQPFYFNYSFTPLFDSIGNVYGVMNTAADVTDLNVIKEKLEKSEANLRNTILQAPVAMCILSGEDFVLELANERMFELWGKPSSVLMGRPIFEALTEAKGQGFEQLLQNVFQTGEPFSALGVPITLPRASGLEEIFINFLYTPYREPDGSISGILAVATDVTEQVIAKNKIEEVVKSRTSELATTNERLHKSNSELEQFAYIASHDLQEPLRKITTFTQLLEQTLKDLDEKSENYLQKIKNASARMAVLIRDVLTFSQLSTQHPVAETVDLNNVLATVINDFDILIEQKGASIEQDTLPVVVGIGPQLTQLFANLISNSLKYSRSDVKPIITIVTEKMFQSELNELKLKSDDRAYWKITFRDNGIGFSEQHTEQIFNIFQRLHRHSEYAGTGIGLAICKKIAENHNGQIYAKPGKDAGAEFIVMLPEK